MRYWIYTPKQDTVWLPDMDFYGAYRVPTGEGIFTAWGYTERDYVDVVDVSEGLVPSFENFLAEARSKGILLEIMGRSE